MAISAGQCCFPYKARCALSELSDKSKSQSYRYYEKQRRWGAPFLSFMLAASAIILQQVQDQVGIRRSDHIRQHAKLVKF